MPRSLNNILLVDDDDDIRRTAELLLTKAGFGFQGAPTPEDALSRIVSTKFDAVLLDLNFTRAQTSGAEGLACLRDILRHDPDAQVIVITGHSGLGIAVQALRNGARDFIMKPWNNERLIEAVEQAVASRKSDALPPEPAAMIGPSQLTRRLKDTLDRYASLTVSVLIRGEVGVGKTLAATTLHRLSGRTHLVHLDAGGMTLESLTDQPNTTVIVENIHNLTPASASALHHWLNRAPLINSRLVSTTERLGTDLGLDRGLTYAVSTLDMEIPPLRERRDDIVPIAEYFVRVVCHRNNLAPKTLSDEVQARLKGNPWSDNLHALRHAIERAAVSESGNIISDVALGLDFDATTASPAPTPKLADTEKTIIEAALERCNFNVSAAAQELGLTRPALYRRMTKYGL
ncbi:sigma-54-dependent transcriptional regulator [Asticcacaulis sp. 201]|uniref:sigma-54-dependent transcriptional regulator n=1 Tax=Asticcacaulis sp. 201 TaxID=3028787 RepID=UPI00291618E6|nr:response regulator [Asticcacaulis sp. 201]MDV6332932.1 response regulator [Asticcacaulis sp. 201]